MIYECPLKAKPMAVFFTGCIKAWRGVVAL
jgi:hypothetical protein